MCPDILSPLGPGGDLGDPTDDKDRPVVSETRHPKPRIIAPDVTIVRNLKEYHNAPLTAQTIGQALSPVHESEQPEAAHPGGGNGR